MFLESHKNDVSQNFYAIPYDLTILIVHSNAVSTHLIAVYYSTFTLCFYLHNLQFTKM